MPQEYVIASIIFLNLQSRYALNAYQRQWLVFFFDLYILQICYKNYQGQNYVCKIANIYKWT